jgi:hypothetical protein
MEHCQNSEYSEMHLFHPSRRFPLRLAVLMLFTLMFIPRPPRL